MQRLADHEWLHVAERLPVGSSTRIKHVCGATPALVVHSEPTRLSAYCFRCKQWGSRSLEHRRPVEVVQDGRRAQRLPADYVQWDSVPLHDQQYLLRWIVSKGIDPNMLPLDRLRYSHRHYRLAFPVGDGQYMARALGDTYPKWSHYTASGSYCEFFELTGHPYPQGQYVVLVEDLLSAYKVHHSTGYSTFALLGTTMPAALSALLAQQFQVGATVHVFVMLDGDRAGRTGAQRIMRELGFHQHSTSIVQLGDNLDPKDLTIGAIRKLLEVQ